MMQIVFYNINCTIFVNHIKNEFIVMTKSNLLSVNTSHSEALEYHSRFPRGKVSIVPTKPYTTQKDLSLAYTPGVAEPCLEIEKNPDMVDLYTNRQNLVAIISNGTAVLGLGDIGALASKPVMEGKSVLFKSLSGIDAIDIEVDTKDVEKFIETVKLISPTFGGVNLEDIKAPECFEIERRLKEELSIPVMHDDQHGTAIITAAALINASELAGKSISEMKFVVNGAGAAAIACARLYRYLGAKAENMVMCDSKGVIRNDNPKLSSQKREFATSRDILTLSDALIGADMFLGVSKGNVLTKEMIKSMARKPIVFALANPTPEISYDEAIDAVEDIIFATGRSDYPNQVNNVIGFPYIFRGAMDVKATDINEQMKIAAAYEIAAIAKEDVPSQVKEAYEIDELSFGKDYIIPKPLDHRLFYRVSTAVAKAAISSGVARIIITDWDKYQNDLDLVRSFKTYYCDIL